MMKRHELSENFENEAKTDAYYQFNKHFNGSLYKNLESNIPYSLMVFKDLSHADLFENITSFILRHQHRQCIEAYANKFDLERYIKLNHLVPQSASTRT